MLSKKLLSASQPDVSPIQFVGYKDGDETSSSAGLTNWVSFDSSAISGVQSGDLLLLFISDDLSIGTYTYSSGWANMYAQIEMNGSCTVMGFYKYATSSDTSFSSNVTRYNSSDTLTCPSSIMLAFRNAGNISWSLSTSDPDDPPYVGPFNANDAIVIALHYQDDNSRSTNAPSALSGYTGAGNCFRYISSYTSSGTRGWYDLSPSTTEDVSDITFTASGDLGATSVRLQNV